MSSKTDAPQAEFCLLFPVLDDWDSLRLLLRQLDAELAAAGAAVDVWCVDDGSRVPAPDDLFDVAAHALRAGYVLTLKGNFGHQRAIAVGLSHLAANHSYAGVIVMDADGEDRPEDVPRLIAAYRHAGERVVFAQRTRRSEGAVFTVGYHVYRLIHRVLTGIPVRVGNFSLIPQRLLHRLVVTSDLWNHCAAAVVHARLPSELMPTTRGNRLAGRSTMNLQSLIRHGLSAMSVFSDRIGVRLLVAAASLLIVLVALAAAAAVFGWWSALPAALLLLTAIAGLLLAQAVLILTVFVLTVLRARGDSSFVPIRDHALYVEEVSCLRQAP
jgi:polyisoprenyl-phosphate glycosyltransferase